MKSKLIPRETNKLNLELNQNIKVRKVHHKVDETFNKIFIGNLPEDM